MGTVILILYWIGGVLGVCGLLWAASVFIDWRMTRAEQATAKKSLAVQQLWAGGLAAECELCAAEMLEDGDLAEFEAVASAAWGRDE